MYLDNIKPDSKILFSYFSKTVGNDGGFIKLQKLHDNVFENHDHDNIGTRHYLKISVDENIENKSEISNNLNGTIIIRDLNTIRSKKTEYGIHNGSFEWYQQDSSIIYIKGQILGLTKLCESNESKFRIMCGQLNGRIISGEIKGFEILGNYNIILNFNQEFTSTGPSEVKGTIDGLIGYKKEKITTIK